MMQCQYCGDTQGPWVYTEKNGMLCEECYEFLDVVDRASKLIKKRYDKRHDDLDAVIYMELIENKVYDEIGLK